MLSRLALEANFRSDFRLVEHRTSTGSHGALCLECAGMDYRTGQSGQAYRMLCARHVDVMW